MSKPAIAFLGTGIMGLPMCGHLLAAGYPVRAWNRTRAKTETLREKGAVLPATVAEAVADADIVIVMLSTGPVVSDLLFGAGAAAAGLKAGSVARRVRGLRDTSAAWCADDFRRFRARRQVRNATEGPADRA